MRLPQPAFSGFRSDRKRKMRAIVDETAYFVMRHASKIKFSFSGHCETTPMPEFSAVVAITCRIAHILKEAYR